MTKQRAHRGGEVGMNGEFYAGGTFLPNTELTKMARKTRRSGSGKVEIAPYEWVVAPEGKTSLFMKFSGFVNMNTGEVNRDACAYYQLNATELAAHYQAWKQGQRWI